jgi:hypothetical protein
MTPKPDTPDAPDALDKALAPAASRFILAQDAEVRRWRVLPNGTGVLAVRYPDVDPDLAEMRSEDTVIETYPFDTAELAKTFIRWRSTVAAMRPLAVLEKAPVPKARH